jgi:hypothetical protein
MNAKIVAVAGMILVMASASVNARLPYEKTHAEGEEQRYEFGCTAADVYGVPGCEQLPFEEQSTTHWAHYRPAAHLDCCPHGPDSEPILEKDFAPRDSQETGDGQ